MRFIVVTPPTSNEMASKKLAPVYNRSLVLRAARIDKSEYANDWPARRASIGIDWGLAATIKVRGQQREKRFPFDTPLKTNQGLALRDSRGIA